MTAFAVTREREVERTRGSRAAIAGIVFSGLFVTAWILLQRSPGVDATDDELIAYFADPGNRRASLLTAMYLIPFGGIAFIWFVAAFRDRVVRGGGREHTMLSTVHLIASTLFVAAIFLVGAVELALVWWAEAVSEGLRDAESVRAMVSLGTAMAQLIALRAGAVVIAVSTSRALRSGLFPRWFGVVSFVVVGALLLVASSWQLIVMAIPAWVLVTSIIVLLKRHDRELPVES